VSAVPKLIIINLYNKCEVAKLGAAAASILLQNLEPQEKDNER
jgi:hypothetical protein